MQIENGYVLVEYPSRTGTCMLVDAYPAWEVAATLEVPVESLDYISLASIMHGKPVLDWIRQLCTPESYELSCWEE